MLSFPVTGYFVTGIIILKSTLESKKNSDQIVDEQISVCSGAQDTEICSVTSKHFWILEHNVRMS